MSVREIIYGENSPYEGFSKNPSRVDMQGWGSEHPVFKKVIDAINPSLIIEVGTWKGGSALHMAKLVREKSLNAEIVCVDTWLGNWQHWARKDGVGSVKDLALVNGYPTLYYTFLNNVVCAGYEDIITPFSLPGYSAYKFFENKKVKADIVYIDGDHEYDGVHLDLRTYWEVVKPGGVLVGDDINWPGVRRAVKELFEDKNIPMKIEDRKFVVRKSTAKAKK
ncbi:class I SAM-dependent methyltransferase [Methylopila henanensis]|uniref:Class I SAM-dependent methyltransferase n=1 Tax=Methylopila henanensis TaxID=873516 RepID=A0ABW4K8C4_9HYPH